MRDGNNNENLRGTIQAESGSTYVTLSDTTINHVEKLNIPQTGKITIGNREYIYTGFEASRNSEGKYVYTFELETPVIATATGQNASVGEQINYKGIPYYMGQMNEFIRTFARTFNQAHRSGKDLNDNPAIDFFNGIDRMSGRNYTFGPLESWEDYET